MDFPLFSDDEIKKFGIKIRPLTKLTSELARKFDLREWNKKETGEDLYWNYLLSANTSYGTIIEQYSPNLEEAKEQSDYFMKQYSNCRIESFFSIAKRELIHQILDKKNNRYN